MKKRTFIVFIITISLLVACADTSENMRETENDTTPTENTSDQNNDEEQPDADLDHYTEKEVIEVDGYANNQVFSFSGEGNRLLWGEADERLSNTERAYVWINGEITELDFNTDNISSIFMSEQGKVIRNQADWDLPVEERHAILAYDPETEETTKYVMDNDWDEILTPSRSNYNEDPHFYHRYLDYDENVTITFWDIEENEVTALDITETVYNETDEELSHYPRIALKEGEDELIILVFDVGILTYDLESDHSEFILTTENLFAHNERSQSRILTYDDRYALYATFDENDDMTHMAFDLEEEEEIEIGMGVATFPLYDGTIILFDYKNTFQHFDPSSEQLTALHTPEMSDDDSIDNFTVSADGSTIAYVIRNEDNASTLHIIEQP
ncbi:hypothetical protein [Amphibacillus cookii]|uniref:hypothetical protein n=1 Tax=Amphibacillus cookii TaxID=767787 RepID=UPI001957E9A4|nr:hypothetical protein [Amphibacillus cookii]MBM7542687.1 hypothetical protein [Amphibacillus cookii]